MLVLSGVLADPVRSDRHQHRRVAGDSELAEAIKILACSHQNLIWIRQRLANQFHSTLREFYPAALADPLVWWAWHKRSPLCQAVLSTARPSPWRSCPSP